MVNLAGAGVGDKRWNDDYRRLIRSSRVDTTTTLATTIAGLPAADRPRALLNSSAVGWYGNTGDRVVEEDAPAGEGFLADVCRVWEAATRPAEDAGVRVVRLRIGLPLHRDGGMLKPQLLPMRLGISGKLGSGRQWWPWISMADWLRRGPLPARPGRRRRAGQHGRSGPGDQRGVHPGTRPAAAPPGDHARSRRSR